MRAGSIARAAVQGRWADLGREAGETLSRWGESGRGLARSWLLAALLEGVLLALLILELKTPRSGSIGALSLIPVSGAAWMLDGRQFQLVTGVAVALRLSVMVAGDVYFLTALMDVTAICIVAFALRGAKTSVRRERQLDRLAEHRARELAVLAERERIARAMVQGATKKLFGISLNLQAARTLSETPKVSERLEKAIEELDGVVTGLREDLFKQRKSRE
jgi:signal transduction histidine kinase